MHDLIERARSIPNKGKVHIFLGNPASDGCDKTTVEPGNVYSPGIWSCGVSLWVEQDGHFWTPDLLADDEVDWSFGTARRCPPVVVASYGAGETVRVIHRLCHLGSAGSEGVDFNDVTIEAAGGKEVRLHVVVRAEGPAGGRIGALDWDADSRILRINGAQRLVAETEPDHCEIVGPDATHDSAVALLTYRVGAEAGARRCIRFKTEHGALPGGFNACIPLRRPHADRSVEAGFERCEAAWAKALPTRVFCPDPRVARVWERCAYHILAAMECGLPRIGAVTYPVFWIRDCVIVLRALDLIGRHDLARIGSEYLAPLYFGGGFGAESDAPGQGIWALVSHATTCGDDAWLRDNFYCIRKRVAFLEEMLAAREPLRRVTENRDSRVLNSPMGNVLCLPAQNGLIHGRMDGHSPDFFINCWASAGFRLAARAAERSEAADLAAAWQTRAAALDDAIASHLLPRYGNPRDAVVAPYPTGALHAYAEPLRAAFRTWYARHRLTPDGRRKPEPLWTYFEAAQIHNAFLLGMPDEAWTGLNGMLDPAGRWDVSAFIEGRPDGSERFPFGNERGCRGWLSSAKALGANMPHNWTSAEMIACIRDLFVRDEGKCLVLGAGAPAAWLAPGARFGVTGMPTRFGPVSYTVRVDEAGAATLDYEGPNPWRTPFPCRPPAG